VLSESSLRPFPQLGVRRTERTHRHRRRGDFVARLGIAHHCAICEPGEALRIAKVYLLKWHGEGQLPYAALVRRNPHADSAVRNCEEWLSKHFLQPNVVARAVEAAGVSERTLKRRFKSATGSTIIDYVQNLRIEHAKRMLEHPSTAVDEISAESGYEDASFFRRIFRRRTGLSPSEYRRMFQRMGGIGRGPS
jgi:transcriptional regulator GlxA family with amidase domain